MRPTRRIEANELLRELKRNVDELAAFHEIGKALTSTLELSHVLEIIMLKVGELLAPTHWSLLLADEASGELVFEVVVGEGSEGLRGMRLAPGEGLAGDALRGGAPVLVSDARGDPRFAPRFDAQTRLETRSVLAVPLQVGGRKLGVLELINGIDGRPFGESDLRTLSALADYAAIAIDNARNFAKVQELTTLDEHTGLFNARHLAAVLRMEVERARRFLHPVSLVFFDLDFFKRVNDQHGHLVGSRVLREVGQLLRELLRVSDVPTRYGGDEFAVVLPETDYHAALLAAERWRIQLRGAVLAAPLSVRITASFGVATFPDQAKDAHEVLAQADAAMYRAKARSRDAVEGAGPATAPAPAKI